MTLPILPTTVVGSYSMPGWLERLKTEFYARRISRRDLDEIHDTAVKAAIKDQEVAGILRSYLPFYNRDRLHSSLNYVSPAAYEQQLA